MLIANYNPEVFSVLCLEHISEYLLFSVASTIILEATDVFRFDDDVWSPNQFANIHSYTQFT